MKGHYVNQGVCGCINYDDKTSGFRPVVPLTNYDKPTHSFQITTLYVQVSHQMGTPSSTYIMQLHRICCASLIPIYTTSFSPRLPAYSHERATVKQEAFSMSLMHADNSCISICSLSR